MNTNAYIVNVYVIYSILSIALVTWLAATLFRNGAHFLAVVFRDNVALAKAVNRLLVTGFIMFSLGFASLTVAGGNAADVSEAFETSTRKFGILLVVLAIAHLFNMLILNNMRKTAEQKHLHEDKSSMRQAYEETLKKYNDTLVTAGAGSTDTQPPSPKLPGSL